MPRSPTRERILKIATGILAREGAAALSFDAIASELGLSKQAVLYWFPTKPGLLAALFLPALEAEVEAAAQALAGSHDRASAIAAFVRAIVAFHRSDLDRFRTMYLLPQVTRSTLRAPENALLGQVHTVTDRLYTELAAHLDSPPETARAEAMAIHTAALGLVMMVALAAALDDPLRHSDERLTDALVTCLAGGAAALTA